MKSTAVTRSGFVLAIVAVFIVLVGGCTPRRTPPGANILRTFVSGLNMTYLQ